VEETCEKEIKTKRKMRKEKEKQKKKEIWTWWYLVYSKCISYDGNHGWYSAYDGGLLPVLGL